MIKLLSSLLFLVLFSLTPIKVLADFPGYHFEVTSITPNNPIAKSNQNLVLTIKSYDPTTKQEKAYFKNELLGQYRASMVINLATDGGCLISGVNEVWGGEGAVKRVINPTTLEVIIPLAQCRGTGAYTFNLWIGDSTKEEGGQIISGYSIILEQPGKGLPNLKSAKTALQVGEATPITVENIRQGNTYGFWWEGSNILNDRRLTFVAVSNNNAFKEIPAPLAKNPTRGALGEVKLCMDVLDAVGANGPQCRYSSQFIYNPPVLKAFKSPLSRNSQPTLIIGQAFKGVKYDFFWNEGLLKLWASPAGGFIPPTTSAYSLNPTADGTTFNRAKPLTLCVEVLANDLRPDVYSDCRFPVIFDFKDGEVPKEQPTTCNPPSSLKAENAFLEPNGSLTLFWDNICFAHINDYLALYRLDNAKPTTLIETYYQNCSADKNKVPATSTTKGVCRDLIKLPIGNYQAQYISAYYPGKPLAMENIKVSTDPTPIPTSTLKPTPTGIAPPILPKIGSSGQYCNAKTGEAYPKDDPKIGLLTAEEKGINTAIGCIPIETKALITSLMKFVAGAGGGIAFLLMIGGGFQIITSAGNPDTVKKGSEQITSAVIGLLFIIFSVLLLQIIGVDILKIPGFSK